MKKLLVLLSFSAPCWAQDLSKVVAIQQARIQELEKAIPRTWHARQDGATISATSDWQTLPGIKLEYELTRRADVKLEFDGAAYGYVKGIHCAVGLKVNDVLIGNPSYGDTIFMSEAGTHWHPVARSRMLYGQAPGKYSITLVVRAVPSADERTTEACYFTGAQDYSRFNLYATARFR